MKLLITILLGLFLCVSVTGADKDKPLTKDFKSLKTLAEKGDVRAQKELGFMYANGEGVLEDDVESAKWFRKAAEQGDALAQGTLGFLYGKGRGVDKDFKESAKWYRKAAEQGNAKAQTAFAVMHKYGEGVEKDLKEAVKWYRKAADQGNVIAQNSLAVMYHYGGGVPKDYVTAYAWAHIAFANRDKTVKSFKEILAKEMTPEQITKAEALAKEMVKKNAKLLKKQ